MRLHDVQNEESCVYTHRQFEEIVTQKQQFEELLKVEIPIGGVYVFFLSFFSAIRGEHKLYVT